MKCKVCRCTDARACVSDEPFPEPCAWVAPGLCSACVAKLFGFRHVDVLERLAGRRAARKRRVRSSSAARRRRLERGARLRALLAGGAS